MVGGLFGWESIFQSGHVTAFREVLIIHMEQQAINSHKRYRINRPSVVYEMFDDEVIIINLDSGNYYSFDRVGTDIWDLIEGGAAVSEIVEWVIDRYEGSTLDDIENSINQSLAELEKEGLIVLDEPKKNGNGKELGIVVKTELETKKATFEKSVLQKHTDMQGFLLVDPIHEVDYTKWGQ